MVERPAHNGLVIGSNPIKLILFLVWLDNINGKCVKLQI